MALYLLFSETMNHMVLEVVFVSHSVFCFVKIFSHPVFCENLFAPLPNQKETIETTSPLQC